MSQQTGSSSPSVAPQPQSATARLPGTSANCGAGFDCLALALAVYNRVTVTRLTTSADELHARASCWSAVPQRDSDAPALDMVLMAARAFGDAAQVSGFAFSFRIEGEVPPARGVGSSATVIGGVAAALNALAASPLSQRQLISVTARVEGHSDNAAAAFLGGFCVARCDPASNAYIDAIRFAVPSTLRFIVASPALELLTKQSRSCLPAAVPHRLAASSISSCAYMVAAFATGDYVRLRGCVCDFMHEPHRLPMIPGAADAIAHGVAAGAYAGWLSGSGSSVLCVCEAAEAEAVAERMRAAFSARGVACEVRSLAADNDGCVVDV
jgi:homoserine kinase